VIGDSEATAESARFQAEGSGHGRARDATGGVHHSGAAAISRAQSDSGDHDDVVDRYWWVVVINLEEDRRLAPITPFDTARATLGRGGDCISMRRLPRFLRLHPMSVGRVLYAISFANKQIGVGHEGLTH